jgi:catechol 2,3-dioxygenase-like lactoylglutathione lyase family enzyme
MIKAFNHGGFVVRDYDRMVAFYRDVIGLELQEEFIGRGENMSQRHGFPDIDMRIAFFAYPGDSFRFELTEYKNPLPEGEGSLPKNGIGTAHLAFTVEDLHDMYEDLKDRGMMFVGPPVFRTTVGDRICYVVHGRDPEGNWLEFMET